MAKFPLASVVAPTLSDFQYALNGFVMGSLTSYAVTEAKGLDMPKVRSGDASRPRDDGEFIGLDFYGGRDIQLSLLVQGSGWTSGAPVVGPSGAIGDLRTLLSNIEVYMLTPSDGVSEVPFWFKRPGLEQLCCLVRVRQFGLASDETVAHQHRAMPVLALHSTGPYVYGPTQSISGTGPSAVLTASNNGSKPCRPYIVFNGPLTNPQLSNAAISGTPSIGFTLAIASGQSLVVDMDLDSPTALLYTGSTLVGSQLSTIMAGSQPWSIMPGGTANTLTLSAASGGGTCVVQYADTFTVAV